MVRRHCAAGGERAAQPDYQALGHLYLRGQNQRLLTTLDRRARQRRDSFGLIRRGHSPHTGAAAPHGRLRAAQERVEVLRLLSSGEDGGGFRGFVPTVPRLPDELAQRAPRRARLRQQGGGRARAAVLPQNFEEPPLPGGPVQVRYAPFFDKRPLDRGGFGGGGDKSYAPPPRPSAAPRALASASGSRVRRGLPCCRASRVRGPAPGTSPCRGLEGGRRAARRAAARRLPPRPTRKARRGRVGVRAPRRRLAGPRGRWSPPCPSLARPRAEGGPREAL